MKCLFLSDEDRRQISTAIPIAVYRRPAHFTPKNSALSQFIANKRQKQQAKHIWTG
jgi:hypothetical protein